MPLQFPVTTYRNENRGFIMGQVKIYGLTKNINNNRQEISDAIHKSIVEAFKFPKNKKFHRFIKLSKDDFIYPESRTENYLIIEIVMIEGRNSGTKKELINVLYKNLADVGIKSDDVEITIFDIPANNWGIRGISGDELKLNYTIKI